MNNDRRFSYKSGVTNKRKHKIESVLLGFRKRASGRSHSFLLSSATKLAKLEGGREGVWNVPALPTAEAAMLPPPLAVPKLESQGRSHRTY